MVPHRVSRRRGQPCEPGVEVDTSQDRQAVYAVVANNLAEYTDKALAAKPLTERSEMLLGLRLYPRRSAVPDST